VRIGQRVRTGQPVGTLAVASSHCWPETCLHLGVRRRDRYVDPLLMLGPRAVRLKPLDAPERAGAVAPVADRADPGRVGPTSGRDPDPAATRSGGVAVATGIVAAVLLAGAVRRQARG